MRKLLLWTLALALTVGGASVIYKNLPADAVLPSQSPETGNSQESGAQTPEPEKAGDGIIEAADFTVYDKDGNAYKLSDFKGKPVLLNFWASWCGFCQYEMPDLQEVYDEYKDTVIFLIVNATDGSYETVETANRYIADNGYTFPVYYDTAQSAQYAYRVTGLPCTVFITADGYVWTTWPGACSTDVFRNNLSVIAGN